MRSDIQKMISENKLCVMATVADGAPHCSLMSYATNDDCCEIYVATLRNTKKYRNLTANPRVSLLIDTRNANPNGKTKALTVTGIAQTRDNDKKIAEVRKALFTRHPDMKDFFNNPDAQIVVIKVTALQLLDNVVDSYYESLK